MMGMTSGNKQFSESFELGKTCFSELIDYEDDLMSRILEVEHFLLNSEAVKPGIYPIVTAPAVTGLFIHECFGHKSESDFMIGDDTAKKEWVIGKKIGPEELTIIDAGLIKGQGYTPYDDEGTPASHTYLIKNGVLAGRLHSTSSATDLEESITGNARAINFEHKPLVRMTTTYIDNGKKTVTELFSDIKEGIYVRGLNHGSGLSTFTLSPTLAYYIRDGKIDKPVRISVISGNVFEAINNIDGIGNDLAIESYVIGGCGKMDQYPLAVGFAGPHIRIQNMRVQ